MVAAIIGILALIAAPRYGRSVDRYRADAAARRVALDMGLARQSAMHASQARMVFFDSATTSYLIPNVDHLDHRTPHYATDLKVPPYQAKNLSVTFTDGGASFLSFDGFGKPNCGATVTIQVGNEQRVIVVDSVEGKATVQ